MTENIVNDVENFGKLKTEDEGIITTSEQQKNITEFGRRLGRIETEIKARKLDIKELKHEFDLEGVSIRVVCKAIRNIKQAKKTTPEEQAEVSTVQNLLTADKEFMDIVSNLVAKD